MKKELNDLVERLTKEQEVECARPKKTAEALKQCIDRNYVHIMFKKTGTELGVKLKKGLKFEATDFNSMRKIRLEGGLILNYDKVKCVAEIDLNSCEGKGYLVPLSDEEYESLMK